MKTHLFYTDDFMKTTEMIVNQGNKVIYILLDFEHKKEKF